jgi:hypothetical protein
MSLRHIRGTKLKVIGREGADFYDGMAFGKRNWIPAFTGMTGSRLDSPVLQG